jgi:hypothetical protein
LKTGKYHKNIIIWEVVSAIAESIQREGKKKKDVRESEGRARNLDDAIPFLRYFRRNLHRLTPRESMLYVQKKKSYRKLLWHLPWEK